MISLAARIRLRLAAFSLVALLCSEVQALNIWDGGGSNDNWTTGANWFGFMSPGTAPPNNGTADIVFPASGGLVQTPIVNVPYSIKSLTFGDGDGRFVILGAEELTIGTGGITNNDADIQFVIGPVKLSANQTWNAAAGPLQMDAVNLNSFHLVLSPASPIDLPGAIVGSGEIEITFNPSTVTMSEGTSNTYSGATTVRTGTLVLQKSGGATAVPRNLFIGSGATVRLGANEQISHAPGNVVSLGGFGALLDLNNHTETIASLEVGNNGSVTVGTGFLGLLKIGESLQVVNDGTITGNLSLGDVTATVASGGEITATSTVTIGEVGNGSLDISTGGHVSDYDGTIGNQSGSTGAVTVDGASASWTNNGLLYVGYEGSGTLNILAGADVFAGAGGVAHSSVGRRNGSSGVVTVNGMGSTWSTTGELTIGYDNSTGGGGTATVNIENNAAVTVGNGTHVGRTSQINVSSGGSFDTNGPLTIDGGSLTADTSATVEIGGGIMQNGATVTLQNQSELTETSSFSMQSGVVMHVNSGALYNTSFTVVGTTPGPAAELIIDGTDTRVTSTSCCIDVGNGGTGIMTVTGGARVETPTGAIGSFGPGSVGTVILDGTDVDGNPSTWSISELNMGLHATSQGTLRVRNGALFRTTSPISGLNVGTPGTASVFVDGSAGSGNPSLLDVSVLRIGTSPSYGNGAGDVTASNGGRIQTGNLELAPTGGSAQLTIRDPDSTLVQSGASTITVGHATEGMAALNVQNDGTFITGTGAVNVNATGRVNLESGAVFDAHGPINMNGGQFNFLGGTLHVDNFNGNLLNQGGTLAPGHSAGATAISGNYTQLAAATLQIEIGGVLPGEWDTLTGAGNAILAGTIKVVLLNGFQPVLGNSFTIITTNVGNVGGQFDMELLPISNGLTFDVIYNPKSVVLQVIEVTTLPGDYNHNGVVDAADYVVWRKGLGTSYTQSDYDIWRSHFGQTAGSGGGGLGGGEAFATTSAVPEPASWLMLLIVAMTVAVAKRRK